MKTLQLILKESIVRKTSIDEAIVKGHISKKEQITFLIVKYIPFYPKGEQYFALVNNIKEFDILLKDKNFDNIEKFRKRAINNFNDNYKMVYGITKKGQLFDGTYTKYNLKSYTTISKISSKDFNKEYFEQQKWLIK